VINERPDVAAETRLRVEEVIARLGYQPNAIARSLIRQRSHSLGVVATGVEYYGPSHTLVGIEKETRALGYFLLLDLLHHPETDDVEGIFRRMLSQQVDGILWAVPEIGDNRAWLENNLLHSQVPVIFLSMEPRPGLASLAIDNRRGGYLAAGHLLAQGYRRIGMIAGPLDWWEARQRKCGWEQALQAAGVEVGARQVTEGNWSADSGARGMRLLLEQYPDMEAVLVGNDQMALGVLQAIHELGRRVPDDMAVVGFDNTPESAYYWPPLSTVEQPLVDLGRLAVGQLSQMIETDRQNGVAMPGEPVYLQPRLVVRASSQANRLDG
jgi:LacI family transcriptional regulator